MWSVKCAINSNNIPRVAYEMIHLSFSNYSTCCPGHVSGHASKVGDNQFIPYSDSSFFKLTTFTGWHKWWWPIYFSLTTLFVYAAAERLSNLNDCRGSVRILFSEGRKSVVHRSQTAAIKVGDDQFIPFSDSSFLCLKVPLWTRMSKVLSGLSNLFSFNEMISLRY